MKLCLLFLLKRSDIRHDILGCFGVDIFDWLHLSATFKNDLLKLGVTFCLYFFGDTQTLAMNWTAVSKLTKNSSWRRSTATTITTTTRRSLI
jgi:hypothetical protein